MPSADQETDDQASDSDDPSGEVDEARSSLLEALGDELGDALAGSHLIAGRDLWVRVDNDAWAQTADYLRNRQRFRFFDWLSAIDWMQSPFGRSLDAEVDNVAAEAQTTEADKPDEVADKHTGTGADGITGGSTRFQVLARVHNLSTGLGINLKADVGDDMTVGSWIGTYPGVHWHEREAHEMFGVTFTGNPDMRNLYLPTDFEGHPLRKDYPLMARLVKPWPGIVDVEPMPPAPDDSSESPVTAAGGQGPSTTNPEGVS